MGFYRTPSSSLINFNSTFQNVIDMVPYAQSHMLIAGDFNIDIGDANPSQHINDYLDAFRSRYFLPSITIPTRETDNTSTCIDQIWLNRANDFDCGVFPVMISDHFPIFVILNNAYQSENLLTRINFRCHNESNIEKFVESVKDFVDEFSACPLNDVSLKTKYFMDRIYEIYDVNCPVTYKLISFKRLHSPWISKEILDKINHKHFLYKQYRLGLCTYDSFRRYRNALCSAIRAGKRNYYVNRFDSFRCNSRKTWKTINSFFGRKQHANQCDKVIVDDVSIVDPTKISDAFNSYFSNVAIKLANDIPFTNTDPLQNVPFIPNSFFCSPSSPNEIYNIINSFNNNGSDLASIPTFIYKYISNIISKPISDLVNLSFEQGIFPDILKYARVIPLFKKGDIQFMCNYRPISNLHFLVKFLKELCILD